MLSLQKTRKNQEGFTIVELMIALSIFSVVMLISTLVMMQIGRLYTKGVNQANLQNATRNIMQDLSSGVQFSSGDNIIGPRTDPSGVIPGHIKAICIGKTRYTYVLDLKLGRDEYPRSGTTPLDTAHVLWRDSMGTSGSCTPLDIRTPGRPSGSGSDGYEMMPINTRLTQFSLVPRITGGYTAAVYSAYGDSDLVGKDSDNKPYCIGGKGSQFCAISILDTVVMPRL